MEGEYLWLAQRVGISTLELSQVWKCSIREIQRLRKAQSLWLAQRPAIPTVNLPSSWVPTSKLIGRRRIYSASDVRNRLTRFHKVAFPPLVESFTVLEAASALGVSKSTMTRLIKEKQVGSELVGARRVVRLQDLERLFESPKNSVKIF